MNVNLHEMRHDEVRTARGLSAIRRKSILAVTCLVWLSPPSSSGLGFVAQCQAARPDDAEKGFVSIFDGKELAGWAGEPGHWTVEDGAITGTNTAERPLKHNSFLIWRGGTPANFELRFRYKIVGGNSGMQYRSKVENEEEFVVHGYQADIDSGPRFTGMNYEEGGRTFLAQRGECVAIGKDGKKSVESIGDKDELQKKIRAEDWNEYTIIAEGHRLRHFVNGTLLSETLDDQDGKSASSGVLAIQLHSGSPMKVQLKNVRLKELK